MAAQRTKATALEVSTVLLTMAQTASAGIVRVDPGSQIHPDNTQAALGDR